MFYNSKLSRQIEYLLSHKFSIFFHFPCNYYCCIICQLFQAVAVLFLQVRMRVQYAGANTLTFRQEVRAPSHSTQMASALCILCYTDPHKYVIKSSGSSCILCFDGFRDPESHCFIPSLCISMLLLAENPLFVFPHSLYPAVE